MRALNANPLVGIVDDFATADECAAVIEAARPRLKPATVSVDGVTSARDEHRTNSDVRLEPGQCPALMPLCLKLSVMLRMPIGHAEGPSVLHYLPGQEFRPHRDAYDLDTVAPGFEAKGGQRLFTTILYLNRPESGGATRFPNLKLGVEPEPGRLLVFANTRAGQRNASDLACHAGEPVTAGEKWAMTYWWREAPPTG